MLSAALSLALALPPAQAQELKPPSGQFQPGGLKVFVLQGAGALNSLRDRNTTQTVVEVRDEYNQPVRGADVQFQLPGQGPGGYFNGQKLVWTGRTDGNGQVAAYGFVPNEKTGRFNIQVSATYGRKMGYAVVSQTNSLAPAPRDTGSRAGKISGWWKVAAVAGAAAAAGGVVWGVRRGGGRPDIVLQPGAVSLGGPR
jgi:hypothetical protein